MQESSLPNRVKDENNQVLNIDLIKSPERLKFWEVDTCFICPIVGMCLTVAEQRQVLKKTDFPLKKTGLYEIHEALVVCGDSDNKISRRVDALLEKKFMKAAAPLFELDDKAFMSHFKKTFKAGEYLISFWAAAANPKLSLESKRKVFGEIHMSMHWGGDESRKIKQQVTRLNGLIEKMNDELKKGKAHRRSLQKKNDDMARAFARLEQENKLLQKENQDLGKKLQNQQGKAEVIKLQGRNRDLEDSLEHALESHGAAKARLHTLKEGRERLVMELKLQKERTEQVIREAQNLIGHFVDSNQSGCANSDPCVCDPSCPAFDLCEKRVLIVGGIARMESLYREVIEGNGGVFDYHDGYMRKGSKPLENRMKRADMVLCPVNCNSHAACTVVKKLGKKHKKNVHMLHNYSVSAISQVIRDATEYGEEKIVGTFGF
ncbi:hypothetical protein SAMN02746065_101336 [Desulfocicer vacuolatum DSM 3385]|uniref:DUF2325 domain-containing protein n=1 Tax=Desulfocicer vacuolatum DSM 3385 TaxID=1121400 RepID=A0A1W1YT32_9BACT|nr:DUF2325 domain-containing protein [Desulfocicer vacuolatum]SMC39262.1 hypothetical protein SAMN02746065_101336 [Desulfocicer vacuolatum DSM 3385]